jgi:hypothetical protein
MPPYLPALLEALSRQSPPGTTLLAIVLLGVCFSRWGLLITALLFRRPSDDNGMAKLMEATRRRAPADGTPSPADDPPTTHSDR